MRKALPHLLAVGTTHIPYNPATEMCKTHLGADRRLALAVVGAAPLTTPSGALAGWERTLHGTLGVANPPLLPACCSAANAA